MIVQYFPLDFVPKVDRILDEQDYPRRLGICSAHHGQSPHSLDTGPFHSSYTRSNRLGDRRSHVLRPVDFLGIRQSLDWRGAPGQPPDTRHSEEVLRVLAQLGTLNLLLFEKMVKYVALLCDAALEETDGREVGNAAGECITVLRGLVTLDELAPSENGGMGKSHEGQR